MNPVLPALQSIQHMIAQQHQQSPLAEKAPTLIAVSKRQPRERIERMLEAGQTDFGENQVQEAVERWQARRQTHPSLRLHLIGPLQSNKAKQAVALFDVIHSIDREKIARIVKDECDKQQKNIACFVQVNIGEEPQKAGILPADLPAFLALCRDEIGLKIVGLMAIPPAQDNSAPYFAFMHKLARRHGLAELSMGMSNDYATAIRFGATYVRVGTALFGPREQT